MISAPLPKQLPRPVTIIKPEVLVWLHWKSRYSLINNLYYITLLYKNKQILRINVLLRTSKIILDEYIKKLYNNFFLKCSFTNWCKYCLCIGYLNLCFIKRFHVRSCHLLLPVYRMILVLKYNRIGSIYYKCYLHIN